jgi:predicted Zn-dependent peptidase
MPPARYTGGRLVRQKDFEQLHLMLGTQGVTLEDERFYAMQCLASLLGGGASSRLFQEIREKRGLVYSIHAMAASYLDCGAFMISAATSPKEVDALMPVLLEQLQAVTQEITEAELERAKRQQIAGIRLGSENTLGVAEWLGRDLVYFNEFRDVAAQTAAYEAVTVEAVQSLARQIFTAPVWSLSALGPKATKVSDAVV